MAQKITSNAVKVKLIFPFLRVILPIIMDISENFAVREEIPRRQLRARVCGMCGGVRRALARIDALLDAGERVAVLHEPVHNRSVSAGLRRRGVLFAAGVEEIPSGTVLVIGAHGADPAVEAAAAKRSLRVEDATCPLVAQLQRAAAEVPPDGELVFFGRADHPEAVGVLGRSGTRRIHVVGSAEEVAALPELHAPVLLVQTTSSTADAGAVAEALRGRFPALRCGESVCRASRDRQRAVAELARASEAVVVVGSPESANANRLCLVARREGVPAWLADGPEGLPASELEKFHTVGLSAGASTPDPLLEAVSSQLTTLGFSKASW